MLLKPPLALPASLPALWLVALIAAVRVSVRLRLPGPSDSCRTVFVTPCRVAVTAPFVEPCRDGLAGGLPHLCFPVGARASLQFLTTGLPC